MPPYRAQGVGGIAGSGVHMNPSGAPDWAGILQAGAQGAGSLIHGAFLRKVAERNYALQVQRLQQEAELRQATMEQTAAYHQARIGTEQDRLKAERDRATAPAVAKTKANQQAYNTLVRQSPDHPLVKADAQGNVPAFDDSVDYTKGLTASERPPAKMEVILDKQGRPHSYDPTKPIGSQLPPGFQAHIPADAGAASDRYRQLTAHETVVTNAEKAQKEIQGQMDKLQAQAKGQGYADLGGTPTGTQLKPGEVAARQSYKVLSGRLQTSTDALQEARDDHAALVQGIVTGGPAMTPPPAGKIAPIKTPGAPAAAPGGPAPTGGIAPIKPVGSTGNIDLSGPLPTAAAPAATSQPITPLKIPGIPTAAPGVAPVATAPSHADTILAGRAHQIIQSSGGKVTLEHAIASPNLTPGAKQVLKGMPEYQTPSATPAPVVPPVKPPEEEGPPPGTGTV